MQTYYPFACVSVEHLGLNGWKLELRVLLPSPLDYLYDLYFNCSLSPDFCLGKKTLNLAKMHWWIWCLRLWTRAIWATGKCMKDRRFITWVNSFIKNYVYSKRTQHWAMILFVFFYFLKWYLFLGSFFSHKDIAKFTIVNCRGFSPPIK